MLLASPFERRQRSQDVNENVGKLAQTPPAKKKRILLVEDDCTSRLFLFNQLKKRGVEVDTAPNGGLALKKLKAGGFDAVILDLVLPDVRGKALIKDIRKSKQCSEILIFVVTSAQRMDLLRKRGTKAGATKVLDKAAPIEKIAAEILGVLCPKPKEPDPPAEERKEAQQQGVPSDVFEIPALRRTAAETPSASPAQVVGPPPLPSGPMLHEASGGQAVRAPGGPAPAVLNAALLRAVADAGRAARGTPPPNAPTPDAPKPVLAADTPLHIPELAEVSPDASPATKAPSAAPIELPTGALEPVEAVATAAATSSLRPNDPAVRELEDQLSKLRRDRDELLGLLRDHPMFGAGSEPSALIQATLDEAKAAAKRAEAAYEAESARARQFEEELKRIREARDELNRKLAEDEKTAAESQRRTKELEERLAQSTAELDQAKAELHKNTAEHSALESELHQQISLVLQSADAAKAAYQEQAARAQRLTEELETLRKAREELNARLQAETQAAAESKRRIEEREQQLREREAEVARLKAELNRRSADSELTKKLTAAQVAARDAHAVYKEEAARGAQFDKELARLNQAREELNAKLAREEQTAAEARRRSGEMEQKLAARNAELDRLKSELNQHVEERKALEQQLQEQVAKAKEAAERVRQEFQQQTRFLHRSAADKNALCQARDELNARLEHEQQAAADSRRHSEEVEKKLQTATQELAELRKKLEHHTSQWTARQAKGSAGDGPAEPAKQRPGLAERIIAPFRIFSSRSESAAIRQLEERVAEVTRNRDELLVLLRERSNGTPEALDQAKAAATRAEAAYQAELARSRQFEEELKRIRQARDELNRKLAEEEKAAEERRRRSKELEERLVKSAAELAQARAEVEKTVAQHSALEGDLRRQLDSTQQFAESTKLAYQKQAALAEQSAEELGSLRQAREELNARVQAELEAAGESKRRREEFEQQLRQSQAEVERLRSGLSSSRAVDDQLSAKLSAAENAARIAQAACKEEAARGAQFQQEAARLDQAREELNAKLARHEQAGAEARRRSEEMDQQLAARTAELERLRTDLQRHAEERKQLEQQLQAQVALASQNTEQVRRDFQQETSFFHRSKEEVDALRRARDELNARLEREHQITTESQRYSEELEERLQAAMQELADLRAELEKQTNERADLVTESSRQLQAVKAASAKAEKAYKEQLKRSAKFEKQLGDFREKHAAMDGNLKGPSADRSSRKVEELEEQAAAQAAELEKARAQFEQLIGERQRLECEYQSAGAASQGTDDLASAEPRFRESINSLARVTAQLEKERAERRRGEERATFLSRQLQYLQEELRRHIEIELETQQRIAGFEQQLREREAEVARTTGDFQKEAAARQLVQAQLKATGDMGSQLQNQFSLLDEAKRVFHTTQEQLQARLEASLAAGKEAESLLQAQIAERKRVAELLADTHRKVEEQSQQSAAEIARLQSALELETIERRKQESHSLQLHYASLDPSRLGRAFVNGFRAHLRPSAEHLLARTRRLLELPLKDEEGILLKAALENALILQTSMQEDAPLPGAADAAETSKAA